MSTLRFGREGTYSESEFSLNTEFMPGEMQKICKSDADVACSTIISFVICPSFLSQRHSFLQGIDSTESAQIYNCGMMRPYANISSSGWAL